MKAIRTALAAVVFAAACADPSGSVGPASTIRPVTSTTLTGLAGVKLTDPIRVQVFDANGHEVQGTKVQFAIVQGDGTLDTHLAITDADGIAEVNWTLSRVAGQNQVIASMFGSDSIATFTATGIPGPGTAVSIYPHVLRLPSGTTSGQVAAAVVDQFGNPVAGAPTYSVKDPSAATVDGTTGAVARVSTSGSTYVIASSGTFRDSSLVILLSSTDTPCTGITATANLGVGEVAISNFFDGGVCVPTAGEYALLPFFDSFVPSAQTLTVVSGFGVVLASGSLSALRPLQPTSLTATASQAMANRASFDAGLRESEREGVPVRAAAARAWYTERLATRRASRTVALPTIGSLASFNTNADDFCTNPRSITARLVAVTAHAMVYADTGNAAGGFTDAEMTGYGTTFDTLAYPTDVTNFGEPSDIDENGHVIVLFTKEVNRLGGGILGFAYSRDLLPKLGTYGSCPGSNVAEILYMRVPDGSTSKSFVDSNTPATLAHEFQHMINAGRRLYVNMSAAPAEERWLNEGLSHVAEELAFYHGTGLTPRQNLASVPAAQQKSLTDMMHQNFARFDIFMGSPSTESPVGLNDNDDDLATRGAAWSLLRYLADHKFASNESSFWLGLENANTTGMENLELQVGTTLHSMIRDWTISNWMDDLVPTAPEYQKLSWNLRKIDGVYNPSYASLTSATTPTNTASLQIPLRALSAAFVRFGVPTGKEAYVRVSGFNSLPLPAGIRLALVRTK